MTATVQEPLDVKYYRSDEPLRLGIEHFNRGNFGIAERYFRDATEKAPKDPTAWIGLAASYDRIARFDLADRAYVYAIRLVGETTEILNNQGYSYMLRGDLAKARAKFVKALEREPNNPTILNNLQLLNSSYRFVQRSPAQSPFQSVLTCKNCGAQPPWRAISLPPSQTVAHAAMAHPQPDGGLSGTLPRCTGYHRRSLVLCGAHRLQAVQDSQ